MADVAMDYRLLVRRLSAFISLGACGIRDPPGLRKPITRDSNAAEICGCPYNTAKPSVVDIFRTMSSADGQALKSTIVWNRGRGPYSRLSCLDILFVDRKLRIRCNPARRSEKRHSQPTQRRCSCRSCNGCRRSRHRRCTRRGSTRSSGPSAERKSRPSWG